MAAPKLKPQIENLLITESLPDRDLLWLARAAEVSHVVQNDGWQPEMQIQIANEMLCDPKSFIRNPIETLVTKDEARNGRHFIFRCDASEKKNRMLEELEKFLTFSTSTSRRSETACLIMDELFNNATRNARMIAASSDAGQGLRLVEAFAFASSHQLVLGCRDSFGRLAIPAVLARIETCLVDGVAESIRRGTEGAGIGSYLVFDACDSYFVAVHEGAATVVGGVIALEGRAQSKAARAEAGSESGSRKRFKHLHLIHLAK